MTKNRIEYAFVFAVVLALFLFYLNFFFFYLLLALLLFPPVSGFLSSYISKKAEISARVMLSAVGTGNPVPVKFTVVNSTPFPLPGLKAEYVIDNGFYPNGEIQEINLPLRRGKHDYDWSVTAVYSGNVRLTGKRITVRDYLGLFRFEKELSDESFCSVFPSRSQVITQVIEGLFTEGEEQTSDTADTVEDVTQIKEFREYRPGDRMQRVNWKLSARHDSLYVKEFEREFNRTLTLLVELRRDSTETGFLDELITAFYSSALQLIEMDMRFCVQWYDDEHGRMMRENVEETDTLNDVLCQMFMMKSYEGYPAFEKYSAAERKNGDMAVYFTSPEFSDGGGYDVIGTYKERVALICL